MMLSVRKFLKLNLWKMFFLQPLTADVLMLVDLFTWETLKSCRTDLFVSAVPGTSGPSVLRLAGETMRASVSFPPAGMTSLLKFTQLILTKEGDKSKSDLTALTLPC